MNNIQNGVIFFFLLFYNQQFLYQFNLFIILLNILWLQIIHFISIANQFISAQSKLTDYNHINEYDIS